MFKFPTSRLFSTLKSALRPAMPRFKVSATRLLTLAWIFCWCGSGGRVQNGRSMSSTGWLRWQTAGWRPPSGTYRSGLAHGSDEASAKLEKQQKQQREEEKRSVDRGTPPPAAISDHWLLRAAPHLDNRRYLVAVAVVYGHWSCG